MPPTWKACICASAALRAAASVGATGAKISAPRYWAWSRRSQVKNAVIVPVGAKGGFFPKAMPAAPSREQMQATGVAAYQTLINALLDVTDNLKPDGSVVPPPHVLRHDGDDAYLVVAADKGTATFSDIANKIAEDRDFWLGDAFASGGSHGYDHKKMGITARGAWEAVKRHFRELGTMRHPE